ncbi:hypothetical protein SAMN05880582_1011697 [Rhizobium sp. RU20A]|uniref:hypothetical protein n=1 Tax=Rhizobium sp. RU20A TaxID=1907412 RepID=UPI000954D01F|nr:hypothetical protein [Rhizobium sp. RU20A]SIQ39016.1 hypothetical protein SAMN05880582_1011697 [Rhizobium sp. RU20A]
MRRSFLSILAFSLALTATPLLAQTAGETPAVAALTSPKEKLDGLFAELKRARDDTKATAIANRIRMEWADSGSASINLLMQWAEKAVSEKRNGAALDLFDQVVILDPDYVEGWNRRATLHYQMGNFRKSMSDINRVLALEPRHFGALAGMAAILSDAGKDELALKAWEQFLAVYPSERNAQKQVGDLEEKLAGSRT